MTKTMNDLTMYRIVRSVSIAGNVLLYGVVLAFILSCAALLSYLEPIKEGLLP